MIDLLKKARRVFFILIVVTIAGFGAGLLAGKAKAVDIQQARTSRLFELNRNLEYQIPGKDASLPDCT